MCIMCKKSIEMKQCWKKYGNRTTLEKEGTKLTIEHTFVDGDCSCKNIWIKL